MVHNTSAAMRAQVKQKDTQDVKVKSFKVKAHHCQACAYSTHDIGMHATQQGQKLRWSKTDISAQLPLWYPTGRECYYCMDTRRRYWNDDVGECLAKRKANAKLEEQVMERRKDKVQGTHMFKTMRE